MTMPGAGASRVEAVGDAGRYRLDESEPEGVQVDPADYVGSDADEAQKQLEDLGLQVDQDLTENPDGNEEGTVASLSPTGLVALDDEVTLLVWDSPPDSSGEGDGEEGD